MESQQVVPLLARAADGWRVFEASMRTMPVVVMKPGGHLCGALLGNFIGTSVNPLSKGGLDEAFGFAIGARCVGAREVVAKTEW